MPVRIGRLLVAWVLISVGIALLLRADYGVAPIDAFIKGLSDQVGIAFGVVFIAVSASFFAIGWALGSRLGVGSLTGSVFIGPGIDLVMGMLGEQTSVAVRIGMYVAGMIIIAFGICLAISTDLGPGPSEVLMLGVHRKGVPLVASRWIVDGSHLLLALLFRGPIGVGTILFLICMGPMVRLGLSWLRYDPTPPTPLTSVDLGHV
jgi:uncharacterized membrane protein YczE